MLRAVSKTISEPLAVLFNRSFSEGIFPEAWKMAGLIPIPKKGDLFLWTSCIMNVAGSRLLKEEDSKN